MQERMMNAYSPSMLAAAAVSVAQHTLGHEPVCAQLQTASGYTAEEVRPCAAALLKNYQNVASGRRTLKAIKDKYALDKNLGVSKTAPPANMW
jgi:hypothetical protein